MSNNQKLKVLLVSLLLSGLASTIAGPAHPLKASANGRYLVDQNNTPFLIIGDAPQTLIFNLNASDASDYLRNRATHGFNTIWVNLLGLSFYGYGPSDGSLIDGVTKPFTGTSPSEYDLATPNEAYFAHADLVLNMAATNGLLVILDPIETVDWLTTMKNNGSNNCYAYGQWLGTRYASFTNILWMSGNDFMTWSTPEDDAVVTTVAKGIKDADTNHLHTVLLDYYVSESLDDPNWWPMVGLNAVYTYRSTYAETLNAYNRTNFVPVFLAESNYEYETNVFTDGGGLKQMRLQEYWSLLSGANAGYIYGSGYTWTFKSGWAASLDSPGVTQLQYTKFLFGTRKWYDLVPDQSHALVTSGYGTFSATSYLLTNDYATAAQTPDGTLGICYLPTRRTIAVDMSKMAGSTTARWFDPSAGIYSTVNGSPFANTGTRNFTPTGDNSGGDGDWVLVLETQPPEMQPPTVTLTTPVQEAVVSNMVPVSATATDNVAVVGVQFQVDGANLGPELLSPPYTMLWGTFSVGNGLHTVQAVARDAAFNRATNGVSVTVSNQANHLVAAYGLNEGSGATATDASGYGNTGTISGAAWTASGKYDSALSFSGSDWVTVNDSNSLDLTNGMTLEAWVYPTATPGTWTTILLKEAPGNLAYALQGDPANYPAANIVTSDGQQGIAGPSPLSLNAWSHVAGTYDGAVLRLYINGDPVASQSLSGSIIPSTGPLRMGGNSVFGEYFNGQIDEVRIYNRALSQSEIQTDMRTPISPTVSLTAPVQGATVSNTVLVSATATDNVGVVGVQFEVDGSNLGAEVSSPPYTNLWNTLTVFNGSHTVQAIARDLAGNRATNGVSVTVSNAGNHLPVPPGFVQQNYATPQTPQIQVAVAYPSAQTAGHANILAIGWNDTTASISAVNDSAGNTYQAAVPTYRGNGLSQAIYYSAGIQAGNNTVTVTFTQPAVYVELRATEYSGLAQADTFGAGSSAIGTGTTANSGAVTTTTTNELLFAAGMTVAAFTGAGTGFTQRVITSPDAAIVQDKVAAAPGPYAATATLTSGAWLMQAATFKAAVNSPPVAGTDIIERWPNTGTKVAIATLLSNDSDPNGDPITFVSTSATSTNGGSVLRQGDWIFYTPAPGFTNTDAFTYTITDGFSAPVTGTVIVTPTLNPGPGYPLNIIFGPVIQNGSFVVRFAGIPGRTYTMERSDSLGGPWQKAANLTAPTTDEGFGIGIFEFSESTAGATVRLYRTVYPAY